MDKSEYYYRNGQFTIHNYNKKKTFANFLPGLAGKRGIPLWAFYVNRAQLISGFGLQDKNHPITLFHSANKAYENVGKDGFRTFIKINNEIYEPFSINSRHENKLIIEPHKVSIEETNADLGIKVIISYFGLPNEEIPALARMVKLVNLKPEPQKLEIVDGLAEILPAGLGTEEFKALSNLLQSWMDVECLEEKFAFYKLRGSTGDSAEVSEVRQGNFYVGFDRSGLLDIIADRDLIFAYDTSKTLPLNFVDKSVSELLKLPQVNKNKVPSAFIPKEITLNKDYEIFSLIGHTHSLNSLRDKLPQITNIDYVLNKELEAKKIIEDLLEDVHTETAYPEFDAYIKQNYLDNLLRGGYPITIGKQIYHIYARKHGDLERDYNFFSLAPEYYSTGPGNFRDVCQNRRLDSIIHRDVEFFNVFQFGNLIQLDGYNPLSVNGITYTLKAEKTEYLINKHFGKNCELLKDIFSRKFTPGDLVNFIDRNKIEVKTKEEEYLAEVIDSSDMKIESYFGEGYWIDHFTYFLDLIEAYKAIYPDKFADNYLHNEVFMCFNSPIKILRQKDKSILTKDNRIRQYKSLLHLDKPGDFSKIDGKYYKSTLFIKLLILALNKFSLLDPNGLGVEMEAGKPGWNDAMNGLPGLFGSGISEAIELKRIIDFMLQNQMPDSVELPIEINELFKNLENSFDYQNRVLAREEYREKTNDGLSGRLNLLRTEEVKSLLNKMAQHLDESLKKLYVDSNGIIPTYLTYEVKDYEMNNQKENTVKPISFVRKDVSPFLEAPARLLKTDFSKDKLRQMYRTIKNTELYDKPLKQYRTSVSLEKDTFEIGRIKAFTPGWLERESNFLHMTYKYVLGLLKAGLYQEFFTELKTNLVCFMNPEVYGRSILENSSFIATSNNPNPHIHGQGFFARLSGSTVETLNIWTLMMLGKEPFRYENGVLVFEPKPIIEKSFFSKNHRLSFKFLSKTMITYINEKQKDTFDNTLIYRYELIDSEERMEVIEGKEVIGDLAVKIRDGYYKKINIQIK
ncbi:MAG: hypothetical protein PHZ28_00010 [Candidatus Izemoplasmatales bacterium]|nr:hypothetical protein [Candidatus Izemoplasmatales bacterium]